MIKNKSNPNDSIHRAIVLTFLTKSCNIYL